MDAMRNGFSFSEDLFLSIVDSDFNKTKEIILSAPNINVKDNLGNTLLICAAQYCRYEAMEFLVQQGLDVNAQNYDGESALMMVGYYNKGNIDKILDFLIKNGADVDIVDNNGNTGLMHLASRPQIIQNSEQSRWASILIEESIDIDAKNIDDETALFKAAKANNHELIIALLDHGADINVLNYKGQTPIFLAGHDYVNTISTLHDPTIISTYQDNTCKTVDILLERGANINMVDEEEGYTSLLCHAEAGIDFKILELLVKAGSDLNHVNVFNATVFDIGDRSNNISIKKYLKSLKDSLELKSEISNMDESTTQLLL